MVRFRFPSHTVAISISGNAPLSGFLSSVSECASRRFRRWSMSGHASGWMEHDFPSSQISLTDTDFLCEVQVLPFEVVVCKFRARVSVWFES